MSLTCVRVWRWHSEPNTMQTQKELHNMHMALSHLHSNNLWNSSSKTLCKLLFTITTANMHSKIIVQQGILIYPQKSLHNLHDLQFRITFHHQRIITWSFPFNENVSISLALSTWLLLALGLSIFSFVLNFLALPTTLSVPHVHAYFRKSNYSMKTKTKTTNSKYNFSQQLLLNILCLCLAFLD